MGVENITVVTGTIGEDTHSIGVALLSRFLKEHGFKVVELRAITPAEDFINAAKETDAAAILISSMYGMGEVDLAGFKEKCVEAGLGDVILYVGGFLQVGKHDWKEDEKTFLKLGFDRVYPPEIDLNVPLNDFKNDLKAKGKL